MLPHLRRWVLVTVIACLSSETVYGQKPPTPATPVESTVPLLAVMDFEYGATGRNWWAAEFVGKGIAELIAEKLVEDGTYRVLERKFLSAIREEHKLAAEASADPTKTETPKLIPAQYLIIGSITRFGDEKQTAGGGAPFLVFGKRKGKALVAITARIVDVKTGEVVASAQGQGVSSRTGVLVFSPTFFVGFTRFSSEYRDSILGEATDLAVKQLVTQLVAAKPYLRAQE